MRLYIRTPSRQIYNILLSAAASKAQAQKREATSLLILPWTRWYARSIIPKPEQRLLFMDVASWLRTLGLEQYEAAFRENAITEKLLPSLTAEDLTDLGVAVVGHRRALLNGIADLRSNTNPEPASSVGSPTAAVPAKGALAERRQVTVMFSDLVDSTALSVRMDPEDLREVISAYQKCVAETVQRFGGFVAKYMGD